MVRVKERNVGLVLARHRQENPLLHLFSLIKLDPVKHALLVDQTVDYFLENKSRQVLQKSAYCLPHFISR